MNRKGFKVLLISLYNDEAYGLRILHSILYNAGYSVKMLFVKLTSKTEQQRINKLTKEELNLLKKYIEEFNPNLIGFSLVSANFTLYKRIYEEIKDYNIVLGGWQASLNPEETIKYCNYLIIGEAEEAILELVNNLYEHKNINNIPNLWIKTKFKVIKNTLRPLIQDFNKFPIPIFNNNVSSYIEDNSLIIKDPYAINNRYGTIIARGCIYNKCTYCSQSKMVDIYLPHNWSKPRFRNYNHVLNELLNVKEKLPNVTRLNFYDEVFMVKDKEFFKQYKKEIGLSFYCMFYPGTCSDDMANILKESGLAGVWVGIQSGSERVRRDIYNRYYSNDTIKKQAQIFHKYNISVRYDFIFDNPLETLRETGESLKLMLELPKPFSINAFSLKFFPNTKIAEMALERGIIDETDINDNLKEDHNVYTISEMKKNKLREILEPEGITVL